MVTKIKYAVSFVFLLQLFAVKAQGIEDQRKFSVRDTAALETVLRKNPTIGGLTLLHHTDDVYYDLYLDSKDFILIKNGLSLRFRKRMSKENGISYSFQLKSEMGLENSIRMEVEEADLSYYQFVQDSVAINLTDVLDPLFDYADLKRNSAAVQKSMQTLQNWLIFKAGAAILPFQQLKTLNETLFTNQVIGGFQIVLAGKSFRSRFHGVLDPLQNELLSKETVKNQIPKTELPLTLQSNPALNWIFEASFDKSEFTAFDSQPLTIQLTEFEVENKYFIPEKGSQLMNIFQNAAEIQFGISEKKVSKYAQAVQQLRL